MKRYLKDPIIPSSPDVYFKLLIIIAPLLNLLNGINVDLYSPSMPAISHYFSATVAATKNTITMTLFGMAVGCLLFGSVIDSIGRKPTLLLAFFVYVVASFLAVLSHTIYELMIFRFIQGAMIAAISIGCRAIVVDHFSGKRYAVAILYTSIAYGVGPIIGPFIGGFIQHYLGWKANFVVLGVVGSVMFLVLLAFVKESLVERQSLAPRHVFQHYLQVLKHKPFVAGVAIGGFTNIQLMIYPVVGPFVVENVLHRSVLVYGNTALIVGSSYLCGAFINRILLHFMAPRKICDIGYVGLMITLILAYALAIGSHLTIASFMIPIIISGIAIGVIYPNILAANLKQFPKNVGVAMAIQVAFITLSTTLGLFLISHVMVRGLVSLAVIYTLLIGSMILVFVATYRRSLEA